MSKKSPRFKAKPEIPYLNGKGQVEDINAAYVEAHIINDARKKNRRIFGLIGPSKKTMQEAEKKAEKAGKMENINTNTKIQKWNIKEKTANKSLENPSSLMKKFNTSFEKANRIVIDINNDDRKATLGELKKIRSMYNQISEIIKKLEEAIIDKYPNFEKKFESILISYEKGSNLILQSEDINDILEGFFIVGQWRNDLYKDIYLIF